ncbi:uncharacterized protein LOC132561455 [Ylistrum balloti]|uniref:uncharacterized protein LOC132561455 n=1 Tax=Ylistrum balloti TaxID=509963 RepID=UPI0029059B4B|nr:uncharacterized protein LOC132561455 [Ylistrum balloti]
MADSHIDIDILKCSVRFTVSGPRRNTVTRFEIVKVLIDAGVPPDELKCVFRCEAPNSWFATFSTTYQVDRLVESGAINKPQFSLLPEPCDRRRLTIRVMWLPSWMSDEAISRTFDEVYGRVVCVERETTTIGQVSLETGTRVLSLVIREGDQDLLPHRMRIQGKTALVVVPGRPPICLRCQQVGHVRAQCPGRQVQRSYARVTDSSNVLQPPEESGGPLENAASPSTGGSDKDPASPSPGWSGMVTVAASPSPGGSGIASASPSPGGSGTDDPNRPSKRPVPLVDQEGFKVSKKGKHSGISPIIIPNGDLAPGQRTPLDPQEDDPMSDSSEDQLVIDEEALCE